MEAEHPISIEPQRDNKVHVDEENTQLLNELHQNEKALNDSIRDELQKARRTKTTMEADLESRAQKFKQSLGKVETQQGERDDNLNNMLSTNNEQQLKRHIQQLFEQSRQQQTLIKKLEFNVKWNKGM
ncbi:unnamed protein product [Absidia cylindrospora]